MESKQEKFIRIASKRTESALTALRKLKNCSIRSTYEYTPAQVQKITCALEEALADLKAAYAEQPKEKIKTFTLLDETGEGSEEIEEE